MEALEFIRTLQKLCTGSKCYDCPLEEKGRCIIIHAVNPEESVRIVEEWAAEQEQQKAEQERQKAELHDKTYALSEKVDHTPTEEPSQTQEPKRTNKDVLLTAFPNARVYKNGIPDMCPLVLDSQYDCNAFASCSLCKYTHWPAKIEE